MAMAIKKSRPEATLFIIIKGLLKEVPKLYTWPLRRINDCHKIKVGASNSQNISPSVNQNQLSFIYTPMRPY